MSEAPQTTPAQTLGNDEAARSQTGEIIDQTTQTPATKAEATPTPEPTPEPKLEGGTSSPQDPPKPIETPKTTDAYTEFKAPEGYKLDSKLIEEVTPIFKELGLTQDQAQKLVTLQAQQMIAAAKGPQTTYETMRNGWRAEVSADADIKAYTLDGKTGLDAVKIDIGRAMATLDPKLATDFKAAMDLTGAGDNPAFIKAIWRLSQGISEGKPVSGRNPSPHGQTDPTKPARPSAAQALFPSLPSAGR